MDSPQTHTPTPPPPPGAAAAAHHSPASSAPQSPPPAAAAAAPRPKTRSAPSEELPPFAVVHQTCSLFADAGARSVRILLRPKLGRGFAFTDGHWTGYRRNYFQVSTTFAILDNESSKPVPAAAELLVGTPSGLVPVQRFCVAVMARCSDGTDSSPVDLIQRTAKREKGPQMTPLRINCLPLPDLDILPQDAPAGSAVVYERLQFRNTAISTSRRRFAQQFHYVIVQLWAVLDGGAEILAFSAETVPLVVRSRSPRHYAEGAHLEPSPLVFGDLPAQGSPSPLVESPGIKLRRPGDSGWRPKAHTSDAFSPHSSLTPALVATSISSSVASPAPASAPMSVPLPLPLPMPPQHAVGLPTPTPDRALSPMPFGVQHPPVGVASRFQHQDSFMTSHPYSDPPYHHAQPSPSYHDPHHAHMRHHLPPPQSHSYHPSPHAHHQPHHAIYTSSPAPFDPMLASRPPALAPLSAPVPILSNPPLPISSSASSSSAAASPSASSVPHVLASSSSTSEYGAIHSPTTPIQHSSQSLHNTAVHQHSQQRRNFHMFPYMQQSLPPQPLSAHAMTVPSFLFNMPHLNSPHIKTEMPPLSAPTDSIMSPLVYDVSDVML